MTNFFSSLLESIDLYTVPLEIRYKNESSHSTKVSIIFSLLLYLITLAGLIIQSKSLFERQKPLSVTTTKYDSDTPLSLKIMNGSNLFDFINTYNDSLSVPGNYIFGFGLYDHRTKSYVEEDPEIVKTTILEVVTLKDENGKRIKKKNLLSIVNCTDKINFSDLKFDPQSEQVKAFKGLKCISNELSIEGDFFSAVSRYISIRVNLCDSSTSQCKSLEEIDDYLKNVVFNYFDFKFYFQTGIHNEPIQFFAKLYPYSLITSFCTKSDHFLSREIIYSHDYFFPDFFFLNNEPNLYSYLTISDIVKTYSSVSENELLTIYLRSGNTYTVIERKYADIFKVLALVCGFYKVIYIVFALLIFRINNFYLNLEICNEIFSLIDPDLMNKLKYNPYLPNSQHRSSCKGLISTHKKEYNNKVLSDINEIILYEAFKFDKYNLISFTPLEIFLYNFGFQSTQTKKKMKIVEEAIKSYNKFKDLKVLYQFTLNFKEFLKFAIGKNSQSQIFLITRLLNKSRFHTKNISNFKIIKNIISFVNKQNEQDKDFERREMLRHALDKYKGVKKQGISYIDEKLLSMFKVDKRLMDIFINGEI